MKQENILGLFFSLLLILLTGYLIFNYQGKKLSLKKQTQILNGTKKGNTDVILNKTEVSKHNTLSDCWFIINNKVYNLTGYENQHPGGAKTISEYCGKDATIAYDNKGGRGSHSSRADKELESFFIGNINEKIQEAPSKVMVTSPVNREEKEEDDDD